MFSIAIVRRRVLRPALVMMLALGLTPGLRPMKGIDLPLDQPFPQLRRAGESLISYQPGRPGASGAVSPLDVGPVPTVRETIRSAGSAP